MLRCICVIPLPNFLLISRTPGSSSVTFAYSYLTAIVTHSHEHARTPQHCRTQINHTHTSYRSLCHPDWSSSIYNKNENKKTTETQSKVVFSKIKKKKYSACLRVGAFWTRLIYKLEQRATQRQQEVKDESGRTPRAQVIYPTRRRTSWKLNASFVLINVLLILDHGLAFGLLKEMKSK